MTIDVHVTLASQTAEIFDSINNVFILIGAIRMVTEMAPPVRYGQNNCRR